MTLLYCVKRERRIGCGAFLGTSQECGEPREEKEENNKQHKENQKPNAIYKSQGGVMHECNMMT